MRILIIANIPPFATGGAETQARMLAEEFVALGHTVTVAGNKIPKNTVSTDFSFKAVRIGTVPNTKLTRGLSYFVSLSWFVLKNRNKFDVIYCRFLGEAALSVCLLKQAFRINIPLVPCTACAGKMGDAEYVRNLPFSRYLIRLVNRRCDAINNISPKIGEELISIGVDPKLLKFLPNGIRINKQKLKTSVSKVRKIVFLGRLAAQKAIPVLLDSVERLIASGLSLELHIIGDGPDRDQLMSYVTANHLDKLVFFHGHVENPQITEYLSNYDIFVLPSLYEGFATAVIEAMLAGLPVVVTKSGGPDYFVDDAVGRVCDPGNSDALTSALAEVLRMGDNELLEMGERGQRRVVEKFNIKKIAKDYIELFTVLIK